LFIVDVIAVYLRQN